MNITQEEEIKRRLLEEAAKPTARHLPIEMVEPAVYMIAKENDGVLQIIDKTSNTDKTIVTTEAQKLARENSHDYVVLKIVSKHKKVVTTKDIIYA